MPTTSPSPVTVVGAGLAGCECAWQLAERGVPVVLYEMRPLRSTPAHKTGDLAELVCSNSLRSDDPEHAAGLLKRQMEGFGSLVIASARRAAVPAGGALAVDRDRFAATVGEALLGHPRITLRREEITDVPAGDVVIATGPLTAPRLTERLQELLGSEYLYFYDAIAPIVDAESLDYEWLFWASRYGKGEGDDYLNAPFDEEGYLAFHRAITEADVLPLHDFERALFFEGCLPIEELARRGVDTLRYGPMKPVGLQTPDGRRPHAVVQLRQENLARSHLNMVGFQSRMRWGDQERVLRLIPGLESAEFVRLGQIHRNTFINSPMHLDDRYRLRTRPAVRIAGQLTGVEGYLESAATGLIIALYMTLERSAAGPDEIAALPWTTALGALARHLTESSPDNFQPTNINYGLFPELPGRLRRRERRPAYTRRAWDDLERWASRHRLELRAPEGALPVETNAPAPV